jgi:SAM-dependent methyltransferase
MTRSTSGLSRCGLAVDLVEIEPVNRTGVIAMAHNEQLYFVGVVRLFLPGLFNGKTVLEVGSLDINGSVRMFFENCAYTGIDIGDGPGVDIVCRGENFMEPDRSYDVVVSCEMMEHNSNWRETWLNMLRLVKPGGLVVMTCAGEGRRRHGTSDTSPGASPLTVSDDREYYQNLTAEDFCGVVDHDARFSVWSFYRDCSSHDLYFFGLGREASDDAKASAAKLKVAVEDYYRQKNILGLH